MHDWVGRAMPLKNSTPALMTRAPDPVVEEAFGAFVEEFEAQADRLLELARQGELGKNHRGKHAQLTHDPTKTPGPAKPKERQPRRARGNLMNAIQEWQNQKYIPIRDGLEYAVEHRGKLQP